MSGILEQYGMEIAKYGLLTKQEEYDIGLKAAAGDVDAQNKLVSHNLRLVLEIVHQLRKTMDATFQDMVSAGNVGLIDAARRFDPTKGAKFSTYASYWIKQRIRRNANDSRAVKITIKDMSDKRKAKELAAQGKDNKAIAKELKTHVSRVAYLLEDYKEIRLNARAFQDGHDQSEVGDRLEIEDESASRLALDENLAQMMELINDGKFLDEREREIILGRFGAGGRDEQKLESLAAKFHCTRERVRQIQFDVIRKLRNAMERLA